MTGNRSLDEFAGPPADDEEAGDDEPTSLATEPEADEAEPMADTTEPAVEGAEPPVEPAADEGEPAGPEADVPAVTEPMPETYAWSAAGGSCASCGRTVETRWRDASALVCVDCKSW